MMLYDIQANKSASSVDTRLISRSGFKVDVTSSSGLGLRDEKTPLSEGVSSHQAALDLSAAQAFVLFDWFLTFTCDQSSHPGIKHLHAHKTSKNWTRYVHNYNFMSRDSMRDVDRSFELAYVCVMNRCWMEVRKFLLEFIIFTKAKVLGEDVSEAFFRDEYQEDSGNVSHIHGIVGLKNEDMDDETMKRTIYELQSSAVCDMLPAEKIQDYMNKGLIKNVYDWQRYKAKASVVLRHICNNRCQMRIGEGEGPENFVCRKPNVVRDSETPRYHEFKPIKYDFCDQTRQILTASGLWTEPTAEHPNGVITSKYLKPTRHYGAVYPGEWNCLERVCDGKYCETLLFMSCRSNVQH